MKYMNYFVNTSHCVVFLGSHSKRGTILSQCLSTQVYKWVPANLMLGGGGGQLCGRLAFHPGGSRNTPSHFMLLKLEARMLALPTYLNS